MAFFSQSGFSPLFQILDDYEAPHEYKTRQCANSRQCAKSRQCDKYRQCSRIQAPRTFVPAFDVRELTDGYYLDGELPGVDQSNIEIEFTDPHTLVIKGHLERDYNNDDSASTSSRSSSPAGWHQPTVEDEDAESTTSSASTADTAASASVQKDEPHFWASERSVGDFQRTFNFTARVDQDSVRASLKNGVLSVVVPKEAAPTPKKIRIL